MTAASPPSANAGTTTITPNICNVFTGGASWAGGGGNGWANGVGCPGYLFFMPWPGISYPGGGTVGPAGNYMWIKSPEVASTVSISSVSFNYVGGSNTSGSQTQGLTGCWRGYYSNSHGGMCASKSSLNLLPTSGSWTATTQAMPSDTSAISLFAPMSGFDTSSGSDALWWIWMSGLSAQVVDNSTVAPTGSNGANVTDFNGWKRGTIPVHTTASDTSGLGIKSQSLTLQPKAGGLESAVLSRSAPCDFGNWQPCPQTFAWSTVFDTSARPDGMYDVRFRSIDGAENGAVSSVSTLRVDNTRPSDPSETEASGDGLQGYGFENEFEINWTNATETVQTATRSGLSHVVLDLAPLDGDDPDPAPVVIAIDGSNSGIAATIDSLSGITLPVEGSYTAAVGVRDFAGNWSSNVTTDSGNNPTGVTPPAENPDVITWSTTPPPTPDAVANGWISEAELLAGYSQEWNITMPLGGTQICGYAGSVTPNNFDDPGNTINIVGNVDEWELPTDLSEGTHYVHLKSIGCNRVPSGTTAHTEAKVDLTDPVSSYSGVTPGKWYKDGTAVTLSATDALSGMAPGPSDPLYRDGAYIDHSVNGSPTEHARGGSASLPISGEGQKELRFSAVDFAGNRNEDQIVSFGIDASNPTGYLEQPDAATPTLMRAPLGDVVSGLETAMIEVRRESGGDWILLPTGLADLSGAAVGGYPKSALATARFPDTTLPEDRYRVRVRTYDQAGNPLVTDRDKNGNPLIVDSGAMRAYSGLSATLFKAKRTCKKRKGVKCVKKARGKVVFLGGKSNLTVGYKRGAVVQGFLVDSATKPLARQPIEIYTTQKGKTEVLAGVTSTKTDGSYVFKLKPGVSRSVRVHFPGTETRRDTSAAVTLGTGAKLNLRVSKKRARTGQTVTFRGTVTSFDRAVPASGKIIALQFYAGKKWRPAVAIARTDSNGRFAVKYKFDGAKVKARIVFRVFAPSEDGWGHASSASRGVTMKLN